MHEPNSKLRTSLDVAAVCRELIALPSENPPGGETAIANWVADLLATVGFDVGWHTAVPGRPNVVARLRRGSGKRLILQAHTDTKPAVAPGATSLWTTDPFVAEERDGLMYGLGACDTKGGLAAQLVAVCMLAEDSNWTGELVVQAVADEEDGSRLGAEHLLDLGLLDADGAIVAEPTSCAPSLAQLGLSWAEITISGRAAHAGNPERGLDAFRAAVDYVAWLDAAVSAAETDSEFPGHPRLNVGDFTMPGHPGTVPGECRLRCDIRVLPGRQRDATFELYEQAARELMTSSNVKIEVNPYQGGGCQSHRIDPGHPLASAFRFAMTETGQPDRTVSFSGGSDARYFAMAGTPAVVYGPGSLEQAHAPNEYVPVHELHLAAQHIRTAAFTFLGS